MFLPLIPLLFATAAFSHNTELTIKTDRGTVLGHYAPCNPTVREFLRILYGAPPIGNIRWMPAVKPARWRKPFQAKAFGPSCYHTTFGDPLLTGNFPKPPSESEDCLSINIWTPTTSRIKRGGAAVMLWVYGGAFVIGGSYTPSYNGANFVRDQEDIIIVSFNYRLNVFGFPGATIFGNKANPGLHDVRSAVEWVRDNIARFGGNPEKITLFGESAGAAATDSYLFSNQDDPIIAGAIMQSGTGITPQGTQNDTKWNLLSTLLSCKNLTTTPQSQLTCMRSLPATLIRDTVVQNNLTFLPTADNTTVYTDTEARLRSGRFARIPVLIGSNDQEIPISISILGPLLTLILFTCPAAKSARFRTQYIPTWLYRYFGNWPIGLNATVGIGAYHTIEIPQVFGTYNTTLATEQQRGDSKYMQGM
ncbi:alpha/beta-hydrolase [Wilcoxina mikolae CBS 423.85]|nr:alpha/beta-hydrolase [Wilcoxina mikolae CBS 423.85]